MTQSPAGPGVTETGAFPMESEKSPTLLRDVFDRAVEMPIAQRDDFLNGTCGPDVKLRAAVESLLEAHDRAGSFLADPVVPADLLAAREQLSPGTRIGRYALIRVLGEGGYGTVYLAEQDPPLRRKVALKVIKPGMDTRQVVARFELERQSLAVMDHANIAKVFDAGATNSGYPYFVMELVDGVPITEFCRANELNVDARLKLFATVCAAIQHAHEKGVIHRDLKPGNVLVAVQDGNPMPKVIDFGIAKALLPDAGPGANGGDGARAKHPITMQPQFLGTPQYMSPEQALASGASVDWRSDVYSLGSLLYELLTDVPPFDRGQFEFAAYGEISRVLREVYPPAPSKRLTTTEPSPPQLARHQAEMRKRAPLVRGDLDRIVMKAMEKDPGRRYQTAAALAADVERHLEGHAVSAAEPSLIGRWRAAAYRHRRILALPEVLLVGILLCAIVWERRRAPARIAVTPWSGNLALNPAGRTDSSTTRGASRVVNLLPLINSRNNAIAGIWTSDAGGISSDANATARLRLPYEPPDQYDLHVEFARKSGNKAVILLLSHAGHSFGWVMGTGNNSVCGFEMVDGKNATNSPVSVKRGSVLTNGEPCDCLVKVRDDSVAAYMNGQLVCFYKTDYSNLHISHPWSVGDGDFLGVASDASPTLFEVIEVTEVNAAGAADPPADANGDRR